MCLLEQYAHQILHQLYLRLKVLGLLNQVPNIDCENTFCVCAFFKKWKPICMFCGLSKVYFVSEAGLFIFGI